MNTVGHYANVRGVRQSVAGTCQRARLAGNERFTRLVSAYAEFREWRERVQPTWLTVSGSLCRTFISHDQRICNETASLETLAPVVGPRHCFQPVNGSWTRIYRLFS